MCCCSTKACCFCFLLVLVVALIGFVFGWGVFSHGFHKLKDNIHLAPSKDEYFHARPFLGAPAPF